MLASTFKLSITRYEILFVKPVREYMFCPFEIIVIDSPCLMSNLSKLNKESDGLESSSPLRFVGISPICKSDLN